MLNLGLFFQPSHPPERSLYDGTQWDLEVIELADKLGYSEAWIGEHYTLAWEPNPSPDLLIAQALLRTKNIKLAPGGFLLPYHNPVELAHRAAYLDHLSQGRLMFGVAAGGVKTDWEMFDTEGKNREMTDEALAIILKLWTDKGDWVFDGKYWKVNSPRREKYFGPHIYPFQQPHPPIGVTGISKGSSTLKLAGEHGFIPVSFGGNLEYVASHWEAVEEGSKRSGKTPNRLDWRITRDIIVADTDEEAYDYAVNGMLGRKHDEYYLDIVKGYGGGFIDAYKHSPEVTDDEVTTAYLAKHSWILGSPETVAKRLDYLYEYVGGFGTLLLVVADYADNPDPWKKSMKLMIEEVLPRMKNGKELVSEV